eukprot:TCONS_00013816-protein
MFCGQCGQALLEADVFCGICGERKAPTRIEQLSGEKEIIEYYFHRGFVYESILLFLNVNHGIQMSLRTLKRRLGEYGLKKKDVNVNEGQIRTIIEREIEGPSSQLGYRGMWNKLRTSYSLTVPRDTVMRILKDVDPDGTEERRKRRLIRRVYRSQGPNWAWHIDGYDKLKPYGLPIHGCIDGFSRKILWLKVCKSNNNPVIPA